MLRFVGDDQVPLDRTKQCGVAAYDAVTGHDDRVVRCRFETAVCSMEDVDVVVGHETSGLAGPVVHQRCWTDDQRWTGSDTCFLRLCTACRVKRKHLNGLAQTHIVGQASAEAELAQIRHPCEATLLIVA